MDSGDDRSSTAGVGSDWTLIPGPVSALIDKFKILKVAEESERTLIRQLVDSLGATP